ncbi:T9SS type A sorting domain-containing protein [Candidatus Fermentibacteria bacterium]|nr:T9SS type A sorting domain-containing protein [Candidatus Fermentibacteria bacterium]
MTASLMLVLMLLSTGRFPEVEPTFFPRAGTLAGDSLAVLTSPQQLIPAYCPSIVGAMGELTVAISGDSGLVVLHSAAPGEPWQPITAIGPCDTLPLCPSFPGLVAEDQGTAALSTIVQRCSGGTPYAFYQTLDPSSPDSCSASGMTVTDSAPDSSAAPHDPALVIPSRADGLVALSVWDPTTWDSYLFTLSEGETAFAPDPTAWSSAFPRPDTIPGGPTPIAVGPSGEITACVLAEAGDSLHVALQPWVTRSRDGGENWDELVLLPAEAHGSALGDSPGRMPYGSFRGGTSWYGPQLVYAGSTPLVFWTARRSPVDTSTAEERLWSVARALLCSYPTDDGWQTTYVGRAMNDSALAYDTADWPTVALDGRNAVVLWSDLSEDGSNLDVWACGHDAGTGTWTEPVSLTATSGSEAFLEAAGPVTSTGDYALLCGDARLLYGETSALCLTSFRLDPVYDAGFRTDVLPAPSSVPDGAHPAVLTLKIHPNPASSSFRLVTPASIQLTRLTVYDLVGRQRLQIHESSALQAPIPVAALSPGVYLLVWRATEGRGAVPLVVVN